MNEKNKQILDAIKGQLIVSCQALPSEPFTQQLHHVQNGLCGLFRRF